MFEPMIKRAETAVSTTITRVSGNAIAAALLLIALGFATAAAAYWANESLGPLVGNLAIAGVFLAISVFAFAYARNREAKRQAQASEELAALRSESPFALLSNAFQSPNVMQTLFDMARSMAPGAAKNVAGAALRAAPRNLPLLLGAGLGLMVASRLVGALTNGRGRSEA
ncbi:MAG: hypothetical protein CTY15_09820 [Methylocystis sp.]|nr:MAG: hypothetical protein CTY15_09820 [Methylocystis sp.]